MAIDARIEEWYYDKDNDVLHLSLAGFDSEQEV